MKKSDYVIIGVLQLAVICFVAYHQTIPGNIDADYYFMGGLRLAQGHGFTENYIWNYFNNLVALPQPSNAYWMPLASIITALGMWLTGAQTFAAGRLFFILFSILIPPLTSALAYKITARRDLAILSGLLAICSGFYLPYLPVTENYSVFMLLGALYLSIAGRTDRLTYFLLGLFSGLMSLARSDGMLWLGLAFLLLVIRFVRDEAPLLSRPKVASALINFSLVLGGFLIVMLPWYLRNIETFGAPMSSATRRAFWLTDYYQTFSYPADQLTYSNWLASGWASILAARVMSLERILFNIVTVQSALILLPFILLGAWKLRSHPVVRLGLAAWALVILAFSLIFPFATVRGTYIHAVSAVQPLLWILAAVGFDSLLASLARLQIFQLKGINLILEAVFVSVMAFISYSSLNALVLTDGGWQRGELNYPAVEKFLVQQGIRPGEPVMITNPPGYTMMTGRPAVMFPYGGEDAILGVARQFKVRFIVIKEDPVNLNAHFNALYNDPNLYPSVQLLGQIKTDRIFEVLPQP